MKQVDFIQQNETSIKKPFGLQTSNSWTRDNNRNDYLYNAGSELNEISGWYETFFRGYDPALGRFLQVDPLATKFASQTPYNYAVNNPVMLNDPLGADALPDGTPDWVDYRMEMIRRYMNGGTGVTELQRRRSQQRWSENAMSLETFLAAAVPSGSHGGYWHDGSGLLYRYDNEVEHYFNWNEYGGESITREQWLALGGDESKTANLYFPGAWEARQAGPFGSVQNFGIPSGPFTGSNADGTTYFEGVRVYTTAVGAFGQGAAATVPGVGIFVNPKDKYNINLLRHEFGHILQARKWGNDFYNKNIIPTSLISADAANNGSWDHSSTWTEWTANLLSWRYFGRPADWDMNNYPIYPVQHSNMLAYPPTSINLKN